MRWKNFYKENKIDYSASWLITYSDMITIILCFFIVFFTFSAKENSMLHEIKNTLDQENKALKDEQESLMNLLFGNSKDKEDFLSFLKENNLDDSIDIIENTSGITIRFKDSVLFPSGKADISREGNLILSEIAKNLKKIDNKIVVEGHTDNRPIKNSKYPSNWELSVDRAIYVAKYLIDDEGIDKNRISVSGFGDQNPIDTNDTEQGRRNNRRIEIIILN